MRVMVDMSVTLLHHGHIRILKKAKKIGSIILVALTSDEEIIKKKGYTPELNFSQRKEILLSIRYVDKVVKSPWLIDENFLDKYRIDLLIHGEDNSNKIKKKRLKLFKRTKGISSSELRFRSAKIYNDKLK